MNRSTTSAFSPSRYLMALSLGVLLGQAVAAMPQRGEGGWISFVISMVFIGSAAASFVLFSLSRQSGPSSAALRSSQVHRLVGLIGIGLLVSLRAADFLG